MSEGRINERGDLPNSNSPWRNADIEGVFYDEGFEPTGETVEAGLDKEPTEKAPAIPLKYSDSEWDNRPWSRGDRFDSYQDPRVAPFDDFLRP